MDNLRLLKIINKMQSVVIDCQTKEKEVGKPMYSPSYYGLSELGGYLNGLEEIIKIENNNSLIKVDKDNHNDQ